MQEGLVTRIEARLWTVEVDGREVACTLKPALFEKGAAARHPVAVGDRVRVRLAGGQGVIEELLPRRNRLARPSARGRESMQVTAANVDVLVIVSATKDPPLRTGLIDRFLVAAARQDMEPLIVVNKCDAGEPADVAHRLAPYPELGCAVIRTSALTGAGVDELAARLAGKTALFVGHSGVGKSSLLNRLAPGLTLRTGEVAKHGRGRHTTTRVSLFRLANGGHVVDTPGIRGFGLTDVPAAELAILMPDLRPFAAHCRYPDCTHDHEPRCAVRQAVEEGSIARERYASYIRMLKGIRGEDEEDEEGG